MPGLIDSPPTLPHAAVMGEHGKMSSAGLVASHLEDLTLLSLPSSLLDLLYNSLILDGVLPYLPLSSLLSLSRTSRAFQDLIFNTPGVFRYLDLSRCRGAYVPPTLTPIDSGGHSWRAERMDENLTEDEFYSGPLRGVFSRLARLNILKDVHTLILDGLASVTHDLVSDILQNDDFNVRVLSVLGCVNLNHRKFQQLLSYMCRPSRPVGKPRLQGLYVFGSNPSSFRERTQHVAFPAGVTLTDGAQLGAVPTDKTSALSADSDPWYAPTGRIINEGYAQRTLWEETLQVCNGIIAFDAVPCTHMHVAMAPYLHDASKEYLAQHKPSIPPLATIALGPEGCAGCGRAPEGAPVWGKSKYHEFPLLSPPPFSGKLVDAVRPASTTSSQNQQSSTTRLIASCTWCLANRHCESCHRWWCGDCYNPKMTSKLKDLERLSAAGIDYLPSREELTYLDGSSKKSGSVKVYNNLCVENCLVGEMMAGAGSGDMWG